MGKLDSLITSTDLVLTITKNLRQVGVVGKFVEFYGPGVAYLSIADRATISNMCPGENKKLQMHFIVINFILFLIERIRWNRWLFCCRQELD